MKNKNKGFIGIIVAILIGIFTLLSLIIGFYKTMKHGVGWVWVESKGTAVKEFIKEENNCVYFIDVWDSEVKTCGIYQIDKFTN